MVGPATTMVGPAMTMVVTMCPVRFPGTNASRRIWVTPAPQTVRVRRGDRAEPTLGSPEPRLSERLLHPSSLRALSS